MDDGWVDRWMDGEMDDRWMGEQIDDGQLTGRCRIGRDSLCPRTGVTAVSKETRLRMSVPKPELEIMVKGVEPKESCMATTLLLTTTSSCPLREPVTEQTGVLRGSFSGFLHRTSGKITSWLPGWGWNISVLSLSTTPMSLVGGGLGQPFTEEQHMG